MSDYKQAKARALELQRKKEFQLKRELADKAEKDKQRTKDEDEKKKLRDATAREARRLELLRANEVLNKKYDPNAGRDDYDPFAEDARPTISQTSSSSKVPVKGKSNTTATPRAGPSKPRAEPSRTSTAAGGTTNRKRETSPQFLGRKEKAARAFAQQAMKTAKKDNPFSVRSLVEGRDGGTTTHQPAKMPSISSLTGKKQGSMAWTAKHGGKVMSGSVKDQMKQSMKGEELRRLCPDRDTRDLRSIDEIHSAIKSRNLPTPVPSLPAGRIRPKQPPILNSARPISVSAGSSAKPQAIRRNRSPSSSSTSSYESERPRKRPRDEPNLGEMSQAAVSAQIQAMFRRPGGAPRRYVDEYSDDGSSDMEAGIDDVEQEERRTAAIARREDEIAEREEKERRLAKERAKKEKVKGR